MTPSLLAATLIAVAFITVVSRILGGRPKNRRQQEEASRPFTEEASRPLTLVEAREHLARKDAEEARKYLEHKNTLKKVHEYLRMEAAESAPSLLEARMVGLIVVFFLVFTFLFAMWTIFT